MTPASQAPSEEWPPWFSTSTFRPKPSANSASLRRESAARAACSWGSPDPPALTRIEWQPSRCAASTQRWWFSIARARFCESASASWPSPSIMISRLRTPASSARCFISARYSRSSALSLKKELTYSTASMP